MPRSVLLVDDHAGVRRSVRRLVEDAGHVVVAEAADGTSALDAADRFRPDLVLLDVMLPDTDGFAVAHTLAQVPDPPDVVLISSMSVDELRERVAESPVRGFIHKGDLSRSKLAAVLGGEQ